MRKTLLVRHEVVSKELCCVSVVHSMGKRVVINLNSLVATLVD